jgi:hypothetical protein
VIKLSSLKNDDASHGLQLAQHVCVLFVLQEHVYWLPQTAAALTQCLHNVVFWGGHFGGQLVDVLDFGCC